MEFPEILDLEFLRAKGAQPGESLIDADNKDGPAVNIDETKVNEMVDMGYPYHAPRKAIYYGDGSIEVYLWAIILPKISTSKFSNSKFRTILKPKIFKLKISKIVQRQNFSKFSSPNFPKIFKRKIFNDKISQNFGKFSSSKFSRSNFPKIFRLKIVNDTISENVQPRKFRKSFKLKLLTSKFSSSKF